MRQQDTATLTVVPRTASRQRHPRISAWATTERATPAPPPSKPLLDIHRARHDIPPEARFARTAIYSTTLYTMPSYVHKTVWHTCKLLPPWPTKGGLSPGRRRMTDSIHSHAFRLHHDIGTRLNPRKTLGTGGSAFSPASLVAPLCKHYGATQYSASSTPLLDVWPRPEPG
jgi:hypothetical protein